VVAAAHSPLARGIRPVLIDGLDVFLCRLLEIAKILD
jgi:hypothetical protein